MAVMAPYFRKSRLFRRSRVFRVSLAVWRPRVVFWAGALAIGVVSVGFAEAADYAQHLFRALTGSGPLAGYLPLALTPAGFALSAFLTLRFFPNAQGSGIPQAIAGRHLTEREARGRLLSLRLAVGKVLLTILGLFSGASIGREGPTVQVGASIMLQAARWGGLAHARGLILAGSAAGISAAFNTPLAGIVFAIEEMGRSYAARSNSTVLMAVIISGLAALGLAGNYTYFGTAPAVVPDLNAWWMVIACGVGGGAFGALFSAGALKAGRRVKRWAAPQPQRRLILAAALCGLAVALLGIATGGATFGTGYDQARGAVEGTALPPLFFLEKLAASFLSMLSGIPGGIFAPSLSVGAGFGSSMALLFGASVSLGALSGMAGYFAGVVQAPMTAFVIILEMSDSRENVLVLMVAAMLGYLTSRFLSPEPLYHGLSRDFLASAIRHRRAEERESAPASPSAGS